MKQLEKIQKKKKEAKALAEAAKEDGGEDNKDDGIVVDEKIKGKKDLRKRKDNKD